MKRNDPPPVREHSPNSLDDPSNWQRYIEQLKANAPLRSFEGAVKGLETLCLQHAPERSTTTIPERFSDGWYASEILLFIGFTRFNLEKGHPNHAAAEALSAGVLAGAWPAAQQWRVKQEDRRRGGQARKLLPGLQAAVNRLVTANPKATAHELWDLIPESEDARPIDGFTVYRDGPKVVQVKEATGREKAIKFRSFGRYFTRARSK
jgi:hypothetical protein